MAQKTIAATSKAKPLPGYFAARPLMPAAKWFWGALGLQSSMIQTAEVALRYFETAGKQHGGKFSDFLGVQAASCGLAIGLKDFQDARSSAARWYVVQTHQVCDLFFKRLNEEYRTHKKINLAAWKYKDGQEQFSPFEQLLANLPQAESKMLRQAPEAAVLQYYHAARNWVVHSTPDLEKRANQVFTKLHAAHSAHLKKCYSTVKAPNDPAHLSFDDFLLFSRAMACFAHLISDACNLQNSDIEHIFAVCTQKFLRQKNSKQTRVRMKASGYFGFNHGHGSDQALKRAFADHVGEKFHNGDYFR